MENIPFRLLTMENIPFTTVNTLPPPPLPQACGKMFPANKQALTQRWRGIQKMKRKIADGHSSTDARPASRRCKKPATEKPYRHGHPSARNDFGSDGSACCISRNRRASRMVAPTSIEEMMAWHTSAMNGEEPDRHDGLPHCGWYKTRRVRGGPWVPVRIYLDQDIDDDGDLAWPEKIKAEIEGDDTDPEEIWNFCQPVSQGEFKRLVVTRSKLNAPNAFKAVDLASTPTLPSKKESA